ncbi:PTI1-like tyrosine-protein kinase 1 [Brassica napus]|uniref:PTI1-like tyrosine-protein kinase 1 n=1 Tax=Brassica napus TaxID=3708 RepID=UPI000BBEAF80|nr:PTI1-like tyrosine-protein kinase 1 [Brassica napus]XP_022570820.1 PTI1-like tyrosine-protein kinase 1 [Brassica napus]XP_048624395.1 PTI1-like tyrosine-protein kinase 1 [Brassica napus]XP_048624396.1 PTI1-like tyrosine-protein kinase 1 [Brassica napus]
MRKCICCTCQIQDSNEEEHLKSSQQQSNAVALKKLDVAPKAESDDEFLSQVFMVSMRISFNYLVFVLMETSESWHMSLQQWDPCMISYMVGREFKEHELLYYCLNRTFVFLCIISHRLV